MKYNDFFFAYTCISYFGASENHLSNWYLPVVFAYVIIIDLVDIQENLMLCGCSENCQNIRHKRKF